MYNYKFTCLIACRQSTELGMGNFNDLCRFDVVYNGARCLGSSHEWQKSFQLFSITIWNKDLFLFTRLFFIFVRGDFVLRFYYVELNSYIFFCQINICLGYYPLINGYFHVFVKFWYVKWFVDKNIRKEANVVLHI